MTFTYSVLYYVVSLWAAGTWWCNVQVTTSVSRVSFRFWLQVLSIFAVQSCTVHFWVYQSQLCGWMDRPNQNRSTKFSVCLARPAYAFLANMSGSNEQSIKPSQASTTHFTPYHFVVRSSPSINSLQKVLCPCTSYVRDAPVQFNVHASELILQLPEEPSRRRNWRYRFQKWVQCSQRSPTNGVMTPFQTAENFKNMKKWVAFPFHARPRPFISFFKRINLFFPFPILVYPPSIPNKQKSLPSVVPCYFHYALYPRSVYRLLPLFYFFLFCFTFSSGPKQVPVPLLKVLLNEVFTRPAVQNTVYIVQWNHRPREKHRVQLKSLDSLEKLREIYFSNTLKTERNRTEAK